MCGLSKVMNERVMMINAKCLEQKINQFFHGELSRKDLGLWSKQAYYDLMKGEYIEIEKLSIYRFLRTISTFHTLPNDMADEYPCSEEEVKEIREILCGKKDICYTFHIRIYENLYQKEPYKSRWEVFKQLRNDLEDIDIEHIPFSLVEELEKYSKQNINEINTLVDLLECHLKGIIADNINFEEEIIDFRQSVGIYVGGTKVNKENFIQNLKKLLECIMGESFFRISIAYKKGIAHLSFILL